MIGPFVAVGLPSRVVFGSGALERVGDEMERLGARKVLVVAAGSQAVAGRAAAEALGDRFAGLFDQAAMHTPVEVTERAMGLVRERHVDGVVAIGGGSAIGLAKALAMRTDMVQLAVPTTYAGSEATPILGQTENGRKTTQTSPRILPETILYDPTLTLGLPLPISGASGMNAVAHAVEALYSPAGNPLLAMMAEEGTRAMAGALHALAADPADRDARDDALYAAWLCGRALAEGGTGLHHKLCHLLGGGFGLPHAETHAILLPHVLAFLTPAIPKAMARLSRALASDNPAKTLDDLAGRLGVPRGLRSLGLAEGDLAKAAETALAAGYPSPRPLTRDGLEGLLRAAWAG